jgi:hypothetical protein
MANDFKPVILAQLGEPPPATRAERNAVYTRVRESFATVFAGLEAPAEQQAHTLALDEAIAEIEAELAAADTAQPKTAPAAEPPVAPDPKPQAPRSKPAAKPGLRTILAVALATFAIVAAGSWYYFSSSTPQRVARPQVETGPLAQKDLDPASSDKARSFQEAMHNGDAGTVAFLLNSGYRPTRVELRNALLQVKYSEAIKVASAVLEADIRDISCSYTTLFEVRKPMTRVSLFDAEDAFLIMKQIGQEQWRTLCAGESGKWREALTRIEQQNAEYNKPDAEKKKQAEACIGRFSAKEAPERWEQAHCLACPENHSTCETYCPQAPKAADADEARFFRFNRGDMSMAAMMAGPNRSRAELYCNFQYLTKATDFDLANLQRFRYLASLFN